MPLIIPRIVEQDARGEKGWDIISRLLKDRIIFIGEAIDEWVAQLIIAQLQAPITGLASVDVVRAWPHRETGFSLCGYLV